MADACLPAAAFGVPLAAADFGAACLPAAALGAALPALCLPAPALAAGVFLACCALQAADLALVLQGSVFFAANAAEGRSAHIASAAGAIAFAIARFQLNAMV